MNTVRINAVSGHIIHHIKQAHCLNMSCTPHGWLFEKIILWYGIVNVM